MPGSVMDPEKPPIPQQPVFADLYEVNARRDQVVNVMGVVVDFLPPSATRGADKQCSFTLQDPISWIDDSDIDHSIGGLRVKYFRPDFKSLPHIQTVGDVVLLRGISMKEYRGNPTALSNRSTKWTVFAGRTIPAASIDEMSSTRAPLAQWASSGAPRASDAEEAYAIWLRQWSLNKESLRSTIDKAEAVPLTANSIPSSSLSGTGLSQTASPAAAPGNKRSITLSEASDGRFCDVVAEVVKVFENGMGREIYITDYTENSKFFNYPYPERDAAATGSDMHMYGDEHGYLGAATANSTALKDWPGPWGQHVLCVMLFHPHSNADVKVHDVVSIRNLRCTSSKTGVHLEGKLHSDRRRPDQIDIHKIKQNRMGSDPNENRLTALRERKEAYWQKHSTHLPTGPLEAALNNGMTKTEKNRAKRRKREELKRQKQTPVASKGAVLSRAVEIKCNPHVRCSHPEKGVVAIDDILDNDNRLYTTSDGDDITLPFVNMVCRARVRVVDFFPPNIDGFARIAPVALRDELDDDESMTPVSDRWEWAFYLLVEDAQTPSNVKSPNQLKLLVAGDAADFLLRLDATDLRKDKSTFNKLKFRLWTLWGDLAELKAKHNGSQVLARPSNLPFECCIEEFGVLEYPGNDKRQSWVAVHRMVQTTVSADDEG